jgi:hypothetical protein
MLPPLGRVMVDPPHGQRRKCVSVNDQDCKGKDCFVFGILLFLKCEISEPPVHNEELMLEILGLLILQ